MKRWANCLWCSGEYEKERSTALYCSTKCRVASNRRNVRAVASPILELVDETNGVIFVNSLGKRVARIWKKSGRVVRVEEFD